MKKKHENAFFPRGKWRKILLIMKLKLFILLYSNGECNSLLARAEIGCLF